MKGILNENEKRVLTLKVVFITPAARLRRSRVYRLGSSFYGHSNVITGPLILGRILKDAGHEVEVYEELYTTLDYKRILKGASVFCIYTMTSVAPRAYELADMIRRETGARVIIGGMHASVLPEEAAAHADQVMVGEGERVILDVVEGRITDKIVRGPCLENLDEAPFPDYSLLKTPCKAANVLTSRGCTHCCSFCTTSRMFKPYRRRSVDSVVEELRYYKSLGFRYMNFEDDNFTADREYAKEICRRMIAEDLVFNETFFFGRTDLARDEEMLSLLEQAHLSRVLVGIESLNQEALDEIDKRQNVSDIVACGQALSRHKIRLIASLVLGIDSDGSEDIRSAVAFTKEIGAYQLQPAILTPFPGTAVHDQFVREGRMLTDDWEQFDMTNVTFQPKNMTPWELQEEFLKATYSFYGFFSSFLIMRRFGISYGLRRLGLCASTRLGVIGERVASRFIRGTSYYKLRHLETGAGEYEETFHPSEPPPLSEGGR